MAEQGGSGYATRGPIPERSEARRRRNKPDAEVQVEIVDINALIMRPVEIPVADEGWEPIVRALWDSLPASGQSIHYEPSDWWVAYLIMETLDRELKPQFIGMETDSEGAMTAKMMRIPIKGGNLSSILKAFHVLMMTEGDRRRMRLELQRAAESDAEPAPVVPIRQAKANLL